MHDQATNMIFSQLLTNEVRDPRLLQAMHDVPRERFVPRHLRGAAYADEDVDVGNGRGLMAPVTLARLLEMAAVTPECRVLVVGALNGYPAAVAAKLAAHVVAVENDKALVEQIHTNLASLGIHGVDVEQVPSLAEGYALSAPYNAIVICGGVQAIPDALASQLALHGRLVAMRVIAPRPGMRGGMSRGMVAQRLHGHLHCRDRFDAPAILLPGFDRETAAGAF